MAKLIGREFGMVTRTEQATACMEGSQAELRAVMERETNTADVDTVVSSGCSQLPCLT